jgi:hypothetical protein
MAIARVFEGAGWSPEQYDDLIERMKLGGHTAPGVLFHWAAATDDGMTAVDVYESREQADALAAERIGPLVGQLGLSMPTIREYEVHSLLTPGAGG